MARASGTRRPAFSAPPTISSPSRWTTAGRVDCKRAAPLPFLSHSLTVPTHTNKPATSTSTTSKTTPPSPSTRASSGSASAASSPSCASTRSGTGPSARTPSPCSRSTCSRRRNSGPLSRGWPFGGARCRRWCTPTQRRRTCQRASARRGTTRRGRFGWGRGCRWIRGCLGGLGRVEG